MKIAIASGKGGTGKTTVAVNLALSLQDAQLIDCDVEEPNCNLFLNKELDQLTEVTSMIPEIVEENCTYCKKCSDFCRFNAIATLPNKILTFPTLCHSCGGCIMVCPEGAIQEHEIVTGIIRKTSGDDKKSPELYEGLLDIGQTMASPVISELKKNIDPDKTAIIDAPPGTACPVLTTLEDVDYCILVTEPTPFGLHDLKLAVEVVRTLEIPHGIIINRSGSGDNSVEDFCMSENVEILMKIPHDTKIAQLYSEGIPFVQEMEHWKEKFIQLYSSIQDRYGREIEA
ncbi:(4Fe-4S)-binding protein [Methanococcoides methylutens]|uniref:(4Fe-4S)-binding protein n=1 Tax=Methanococcoides methylutens TaxID=2226 RepID=A0A099T202_METMT|nr:ATP-binding protein [Methanococcoides methylutens]KGK99190.1 (4Fe-4S)-binding protein [Methanococcoides methylutens]